jgi:hypothetical protein
MAIRSSEEMICRSSDSTVQIGADKLPMSRVDHNDLADTRRVERGQEDTIAALPPTRCHLRAPESNSRLLPFPCPASLTFAGERVNHIL